MKEQNSIPSAPTQRKEIYTNSARNKFTEYGNDLVLQQFLQRPIIERTCKLELWKFEDLQKRMKKGFSDEEQKITFRMMRDYWFSHLKERMKVLRISKETLESYGLSWQLAKSFAYQTI